MSISPHLNRLVRTAVDSVCLTLKMQSVETAIAVLNCHTVPANLPLLGSWCRPV